MRLFLIWKKKQWKKVFTKCDFACIGEITMWKHINTKPKSVHSDIGAKQIKIKESALTNIKDFFQVKIIDGETLFACNICNEGLNNEHSIK